MRISEVREIVPLMALGDAGLGGSARCRGLLNLRGESIPVFDLSGPESPLLPTRLILITSLQGSPVGLVVDEVHDVVDVPAADVSRRPVGPGRELLVARVGEELLPVLEPERLFEEAA